MRQIQSGGMRSTAPAIEARKGDGAPVVMVTAYDAPSARIVDRAGVDMILVGDTLAMVVLGYDDTLQVTTDDMAHHVGAVARTNPRALVVGDLPWLSYHVSTSDTVRNAAALVRAGAGAVKLEGGRKRLPAVQAILDAEIPVMGHLGLTPQSVHALGGFRVQGKDLEAARAIVDDAIALAEAGCFAIVLECVPDAVARLVTDTVAGPDDRDRCRPTLRRPGPRLPRPARHRGPHEAEVRAALRGARDRCHATAVARFADDVRAGRFPSSEETYHAADTLPDELKLEGPDRTAESSAGVGGDNEAQEPAPA